MRALRLAANPLVAIATLLLVAGVTDGAARADGPPSITVLYFDNHSGSEALAPLGKGLADMFTTDLAAVPELRLVERQRLEAVLGELSLQQTAAFDPASAQRVGRQLGAGFAVTGSIASATEADLRIDVRVIRIENAEIVKTAQVAGARARFFDLQQQLAAKLVDGLSAALALGVPEARRAQRQVSAAARENHVADLDLAVEYGRALDLGDRGDAAGATERFERIAASAPAFVLGRARLLQSLRAQVAALQPGAPDRKLLDACKAVQRSGLLCDSSSPSPPPPGGPGAAPPAPAGPALRAARLAVESSLRSELEASGTVTVSGLRGGLLVGYRLPRVIVGLGLELAYTAQGGATASSTAIFVGPGVRWAALRSADERVELIVSGDVQYHAAITGSSEITGRPVAGSVTHGVALAAGPGVRYWLHPQLAVGAAVGLRADLLFADAGTQQNVALYVALPVLGVF